VPFFPSCRLLSGGQWSYVDARLNKLRKSRELCGSCLLARHKGFIGRHMAFRIEADTMGSRFFSTNQRHFEAMSGLVFNF